MYAKGELKIIEINGDKIVYEAALPHSCDEWFIGGVQEIDDLISDLIEAKKEIIEKRGGEK